jgi:hypothetical protein
MRDMTTERDFSKQEYVFLSYDIPTEYNDLADQIRHRIRTFALRVGRSDYLAPIEHRETVNELVKEAHLYVNDARRQKREKIKDPKLQKKYADIGHTQVRSLYVAPKSNADVMDWCNEAAERFTKEITESLQTRLDKVNSLVEKAIENKKLDPNDREKSVLQRKRTIIRDLKKKLEDVEKSFFWFLTTENVNSAMKATVDLLNAEWKAIKEVKYLNGKPHVQRTMPDTPVGQFFKG